MRTHDDLDVTLTESSQKQEGAMVAPMEEDSVVEKSERVFRPERRASLMDLMPEDSYKTACRKDRVHVMGLDADELGDDGEALLDMLKLASEHDHVKDGAIPLGTYNSILRYHQRKTHTSIQVSALTGHGGGTCPP